MLRKPQKKTKKNNSTFTTIITYTYKHALRLQNMPRKNKKQMFLRDKKYKLTQSQVTSPWLGIIV